MNEIIQWERVGVKNLIQQGEGKNEIVYNELMCMILSCPFLTTCIYIYISLLSYF